MGVHDKGAELAAKKAFGIPEDEPIFILRAKDYFAIPTLADYRHHCDMLMSDAQRPSLDWFRDLDTAIADFKRFQMDNPDKMKVPD